MTRRTIGVFVTFAVTILVTSLAVEAPPPANIPQIGILSPGAASEAADPWLGVLALRQGLHDLGYVEGQTIRLEYRFGEWQSFDRLAQ